MDALLNTVGNTIDNAVNREPDISMESANDLIEQSNQIGTSGKKALDSLKNQPGFNYDAYKHYRDESKYKFNDYLELTKQYISLQEPSIIREVVHSFAIETIWMQIHSQREKKELSHTVHNWIKSNCSTSFDAGFTFDTVSYVDKCTDGIQNYEACNNLFLEALFASIRSQVQANTIMQDMYYEVRSKYLEQNVEFIKNITQQQKILIDSLQNWSDYLDLQAHEYANLYEQINSQMSTFKRKDVFEIEDIRSLEKWNSGMNVLFWILVVILVIMLVVQHFRKLSETANDATTAIQQTANNTLNTMRGTK